VSQTRSTHVPSTVRGVQRHVLLPAMLVASTSVLLLSGCSASFNPGNATAGPAELGELHGNVHGGQAPVQNSIVSIYEIGADPTTAAGYAAALGTPLGVSTATDANGSWSIPSPASCANADDEIYVVAVGGYQALQPTSNNNTALVMTSIGGPCGARYTHSFNIDEVTTVATEYALSGFSTDYQHVGTSATNTVGLTNAFATVTNLVNLSTGKALTVTPAYANPGPNSPPDVFSSIVPSDAINSLANILASCVNAANGASDTACTSLFSYTGGSNSTPVGAFGVQGPVASNTADAALYIAHNPGLPAQGLISNNNVANLFNLPQPQAPFGPALTAAPNDWTLTLNFVGGGLGGVNGSSVDQAIRMAIDQQGDVWVLGPRFHALTELSNLGAPLSPSTTITAPFVSPFPPLAVGGFNGGGLTTPKALTIDTTGNVWVADSTNCLAEFSNSGTPNPSSPFTGACGTGLVSTVNGIQADSSNNIWISGNAFISSATSAGANRSTTTSGFSTLTGFLGQDYHGSIWFTDQGNGNVGALTGSGSLQYTSSLLSQVEYYAAFGPLSAGSGGNGDLTLWAPEPANQNITLIEDNGASSPTPASSGALGPQNPTATSILPITVDGRARVYWGNHGSSTQTTNFVQVYDSTKTQNSPSPNAYLGATQLSFIYLPESISVDQSGNVWVLNQNNYQSLHQVGPYSTSMGGPGYLGNGSGAANVSEIIGLAAPVNPVLSQQGAKTPATGYGTRP